MPADIMECADLALIIARNDHAGVRNLAQKIISGVGNLAGASCAERSAISGHGREELALLAPDAPAADPDQHEPDER